MKRYHRIAQALGLLAQAGWLIAYGLVDTGAAQRGTFSEGGMMLYLGVLLTGALSLHGGLVSLALLRSRRPDGRAAEAKWALLASAALWIAIMACLNRQ
ncbi:hypothetical protein [Burkholderia sp. Ac-20379]|uniref:hypothetical protein n=1 Tax=Burkholderia sp. Ac-20379 TaxID=2703900 RepID=UPI0019801A6E|nr:hypothetical protein [Burkholderia sp. Ac-20379]MBN3726253.1 hypothetical protein [Burkholderia sp. Ac-20379]